MPPMRQAVMSMIERVAEALCSAHNDQHCPSGVYYDMARAAIAAMREPTHEMMMAADSEEDRRTWEIMVDAALGEAATDPADELDQLRKRIEALEAQASISKKTQNWMP